LDWVLNLDKKVRYIVGTRAEGKCEFCGLPLDEENWDFHHRKLKSRGGKDTPENGIACHHFCHLVKIHNHPKISRENGFMVVAQDNPLEVPIFLYGAIKTFLTADGNYRFDA